MESSPSQFSEKISTLVGEDSELDLFEIGEDNYYFTRKKIIPNSIQINDDIFICHNISFQNDKSLDPSLLSKCIGFCMPPEDSKEFDSAQILYGSLIHNDLDKKISQSTEIRLSFVHRYIKEKSKKKEKNLFQEI